MSFWLFKCNPAHYNLSDRLADPNPILTWTVSRFQGEISAGDTVFLWVSGPNRAIRAVLRVDEAPRDRTELDSEQRYWSEPDRTVKPRILGTLTHRQVDLTAEYLRSVQGLENLPVFHGFQQATNFRVTDADGVTLMSLIEGSQLATASAETAPPPAVPSTSPSSSPSFEVGRLYNRRVDIHSPFGGQQQGGISTPTRVRCVFLFTSPSGTQHGYRDGWNDDGVFLYTGEGQSGDMEFVRGNLAVRDHAATGRDLHLFESQGKGEGYRYLGRFDCAGWELHRGPDTDGQDRQVIVFHLLLESAEEVAEFAGEVEQSSAQEPLEDLRRRAFEAVRPSGEHTTRESRRLYYQRSTVVRNYVLARSAGICEACRQPAPFLRQDGSPYLEPHHTRRVADGGPDHPRWVGGICPNCHREIHHGQNGEVVNRRLESYLGTIETDVG